jgi:NADP-dependent 3-hydroxy acid dehydrogenase YdfG
MGCSTGIGRDLAQRLTLAGYTVVATARRAEALNDLLCYIGHSGVSCRKTMKRIHANSVAACAALLTGRGGRCA